MLTRLTLLVVLTVLSLGCIVGVGNELYDCTLAPNSKLLTCVHVGSRMPAR